jgi:hypothetical protein
MVVCRRREAAPVPPPLAMNDLDGACAFVQGMAGITDGGIAAVCFSDVTFDWSQSGLAERAAMLRNWLKTERAHAE